MDLQVNKDDFISIEIKRMSQDNLLTISKWMKFLAILGIIYGSLCILTCYGAVIGWYPILLAVWMLQSANKFMSFINNKDEYSFNEAVRKLKYCVVSMGIFAIAYLALFVLSMIGLLIYVIVLVMMGGGESFKGLTDALENLDKL